MAETLSLEELRALAADLKFAAVAVTPAATFARAEYLREWLGEGRHGEMAWLADHADVRVDPARLLDGARSIIIIADRYAGAEPDPPLPAGHGRIARYARGRDYHDVLKKRLHTLADRLREQFPGHGFRTCVDTAPIVEREYASRGAIGYLAKNTMVIQPGIGSYFFLGEIVTTLEITGNLPEVGDHCGTCTRCIDACPTDALTPYRMDASRCISYLTIEHRSAIDPQFHEAIGALIFGCDICQEVCPHNGPIDFKDALSVNPAYQSDRTSLSLLEVLNWVEEDRRAALAGSAMRRAKLWMMCRNAVIAAGNELRRREDAALRARIEAIAADVQEHEIVRETARQALDGLRGPA